MDVLQSFSIDFALGEQLARAREEPQRIGAGERLANDVRNAGKNIASVASICRVSSRCISSLAMIPGRTELTRTREGPSSSAARPATKRSRTTCR